MCWFEHFIEFIQLLAGIPSFLIVTPSRESDKQWPYSYGCIWLTINTGIDGLGYVEDQS